MTCTLTRRGGFAGLIPPPITVDTAQLSVDLRAEIERLLVEADFFSLPSRLPKREQHPDAFEYTLELRRPGLASHTVTFGDTTAPAALRHLVAALQRAGKA